MRDWADEIESDIYDGADYDTGNPWPGAIAEALRSAFLRGRIAGMREAPLIAWELMDKNKPVNLDNTWAFKAIQQIYLHADNLEKP